MIKHSPSVSRSHCLHARKVISLLDSPQKENLDYLTGHIGRCRSCTRTLRDAKTFLEKLDHHIPFVSISAESADEFKREIAILAKKIEVKKQALVQRRFIEKIKGIKGRVLQFIQTAMTAIVAFLYL
ncbi:MAG: hypothetical protein A2504_17150 [Bdellovibrionales bacterium RIFOXYD12_FULL_39_22]|nr:MAG: hypothetical protein A2385_10810 [Bdellovibrionales bacterium RIFOXYB1_FULL_39_21]OFZ40734.1 MAG: hypothetical protein A2485_16920 [Bdellovibrionales bacterium RIFOXYC12_FULL_39_17]OFZ48156.1 MAG: hypothetical protein A2404_17080 [Bdellovibrionales bacterium RIFOXYC1_FULL_39_130]OFZ71417.1 MAG: hypothetical protein A2451_10685 [Bdellovibrionales bacterium RIFOXYC2_FULL_39_8]OFZ75806.1 MAG: hypothetical protein A2560_13580 [Bdellovibrionales bacterium RIFOXYD1_FULL_39_84]OFZ91867.1 MAG: